MNPNAPYHIGIAAHKRFSQIHILNRDGLTAWKDRIVDKDPTAFQGLVAKLGDPLQVCHL